MNEIVPVVGGLIVGLGLHAVPPRWRLVTGVAAVLALGVLATVVSGEYLVSWGFLLFDIPLAAGCSLGAYLAAGQLFARAAGRDSTREQAEE